MGRLRWLQLFFRIFLLLVIILLILPIIMDNWFLHLIDYLYPHENAILVYKSYLSGYSRLLELTANLRKIILFM